MTEMSPAERLLLARATRRLRLERGLGLREAGQLLGLDYTNVSRAETGTRRPLPAERIAVAFGVTVEEVRRPCPRCGYAPSPGFTCNQCGTSGGEPPMALGVTQKWPAPIAIAEPQPGDFCCVPISGGVGLSIEIGQWLDGDRFQPYDHAEIYIGAPDVTGQYGYTIGAYPGGAAKVALPCPAAQLPGSLWSSGLISLTAVQRSGIIAWAVAHLGTPYSFLDYAALALHRLHLPVPGLREYVASTRHEICSQLVDSDFCANGVHLFDDGRWPGYVTPADLAELLEARIPAKVREENR